jgi:hypothetical protein
MPFMLLEHGVALFMKFATAFFGGITGGADVDLSVGSRSHILT